MRLTIIIAFLLLIGPFAKGQILDREWYSETTNNGLLIQNSFPKGGSYSGPTTEHFNYSYLVFYTRIVNEKWTPVEIALNFSAEAFPIPNSPNTFVKLFLPSDTMTMDKRPLFSYGITELASLDEPTSFRRKLNYKEDCLFYVVAIFYQNKADAWAQERGGNRGELILEGQNFCYNLLPQVDALPCGRIIFEE